MVVQDIYLRQCAFLREVMFKIKNAAGEEGERESSSSKWLTTFNKGLKPGEGSVIML